MLKTVLGLAVALALSAAVLAQNTVSKASGNVAGNSSTSATAGDKRISFANGTNIAAELQNSLNVERAKVGDEVILKTKKAVKQNGETVIDKGAMLKGRVTEVQERTKGMAASKIGVLFDALVQNGRSIPISAMITSITRTTANANMNDDVFASGSTSTRSSTQTSASSPGLVGGVVNTATSAVGSVAGAANQTVTPVVGAVGDTVGRATNAVTNIPGLRVDQSTNASASGSSTLTMNGGNVNLQKGTTFNLELSESSSVSTKNSSI